ncbi:MAG TPA: helix-turn-helix domain-containing protein [Urbifossiella sp.]|nr:helix-turn-helix domain-containing protein [Urbifossiella sp.]
MTPHRPWTYPEVAELKRLVALRRKDAAIARRLGRSRRSVQDKRDRLGLRVNRPWRENDTLVRRLARDGWHDAEIAERVGCSRERVRDVRRRLGITAGRYAPPPRVDKRRAA